MPYSVNPQPSPVLSSSGNWMTMAQIVAGLLGNGGSSSSVPASTGNTPNADTFPGMLASGKAPAGPNLMDPTGTAGLLYSMGQQDSPLINSGFNISKYGVSTSPPQHESY